MESTVLRIRNWSKVFETAESRKHKALQWISIPVAFNSTGFQSLLDTFENGLDAAAVYGGWVALCKVAATSVRRGVLAGTKGEPYSTRRLTRLTGLPERVFELLLPWAEAAGWLERVPTSELSPVGDEQNAGLGEDWAKTGLPDTTEPDTTRPNQIPVRSVGSPVGAEFLPDWKELDPWRSELVQATREQCESLNPEVFAESSVFSKVFRFSAYVAKPELIRLWHAAQGLMPSPVVGPTVAHQVLVMAAAAHVAKIPQQQVKKSRQGLLIYLLKNVGDAERWNCVRSRIADVAGFATQTPLPLTKGE